MLAVGRVADVADTVVGGCNPGIIKAALLPCKDHISPRLGNAEGAIGGGCDLVLNHIDVTVPMRVVAVPAELAAFPYAVLQVFTVVFVAEVNR